MSDGWTGVLFWDGMARCRRRLMPALRALCAHASAPPPAAALLHPAAFVRAVDWIDTVWPPEKKAQDDYPKVMHEMPHSICITTDRRLPLLFSFKNRSLLSPLPAVPLRP